MKITDKRILWSILGAILLVATIVSTITHNIKSPGSKNTGTSSSLAQPPSLAVKAFKADGGWGYDILVDGHAFIHQDQIPGIPGNQKFSSQQDAFRCGELVISKIKAQKNPSVNRSELDSLNISIQDKEL